MYTKGKWEVVKYGDGKIAIETGSAAIANIVDMSDETIANANLIAAAPGLLTVCKAAVVALTQPKTYQADINAAIIWLTRYIAIAEGKE